MQAVARARGSPASERIVRRAVWREFVLTAVRRIGNHDLSFPQLASLLFLEAEGESTVSALAATLGRSESATSRLVEGLVRSGLVLRDELARDRRARRLRITAKAVRFLDRLERGRMDVQSQALAVLPPAQRAAVHEAFALLADAIRWRAARRHGQS